MAPFPVTALPGVDPQTLLAFQVLGIKTVEHLSRIPAKALAARFKPGAVLAAYARGQDDRPVCPTIKPPAVSIRRRPDHDRFEGLDIDSLIFRLIELMASDLSTALREQGVAGRFLRLVVRSLRPSRTVRQGTPRTRPRLSVVRPNQPPESVPASEVSEEQFFPNQDARIHSMLPQPKQPGRTRYLDPMPGSAVSPAASTSFNRIPASSETVSEPDPEMVVRAVVRYETRRPIDDLKTLLELTETLFLRVLKEQTASGISVEWLREPGIELQLEMSQFAPPEQLTLAGLDGRPHDARIAKLQRQERILSTRFGGSPFRHLQAVNLDSVLSEKLFRWEEGM